ncbi:hypothetical protein [Flavobacterium sp.]|jgi:hypothetical protein|uniref:hypothetical protein n=1 Tax=Flavobacterium sp. TaxID=239 RepID=UPI002A7EB437|nr:hypothetical protein [Flavobacterium sp.]
MKKILFMILTFLLISCFNNKEDLKKDLSNNNEDDLKVVLLTNEVVCIKDINDYDVYHTNLYDSLSKNVLNYKLINNSNKKYFVVLNENFVDVMENMFLSHKIIKNRIDSSTRSGISFNLYRNDSLMNGATTLTTGGGYETDLEYYKSKRYKEIYMDSVFIDNVTKRKLYRTKYPSLFFRDVLNNSFIIYPGETKYFTSIVNLPLRKDNVNWITDMGETHPNLASFTLVNISKKTESMLSENQIKEIEENGYTIFDGVIESNKVPVKMITMPNK